jgi:hypothetical protein
LTLRGLQRGRAAKANFPEYAPPHGSRLDRSRFGADCRAAGRSRGCLTASYAAPSRRRELLASSVGADGSFVRMGVSLQTPATLRLSLSTRRLFSTERRPGNGKDHPLSRSAFQRRSTSIFLAATISTREASMGAGSRSASTSAGKRSRSHTSPLALRRRVVGSAREFDPFGHRVGTENR